MRAGVTQGAELFKSLKQWKRSWTLLCAPSPTRVFNPINAEEFLKVLEEGLRITQLSSNVPHYTLQETSLISTSRKREVSEARGIICHLAVNDLGYSTSEVSRALCINRENAARCSVRGKKAIDKYTDLRNIAN